MLSQRFVCYFFTVSLLFGLLIGAVLYLCTTLRRPSALLSFSQRRVPTEYADHKQEEPYVCMCEGVFLVSALAASVRRKLLC